MVGDNLGYLVGRKLGRGTILRYGAKVGLTDERVKGIEHVYVRYGSATVLFARFFSILRQLNGIVGGNAGNVLVTFRFARCSRRSALDYDLGARSCLFQRAPDFHCRAGASHQGGRDFLLAIGLMLALGLFIRRLRVAGWTVRRSVQGTDSSAPARE